MPKPSVIPRWANVAGSVATPSSGKMDVGFLPGEKPFVQYQNWLGLHAYNWFNWLNSMFNASDDLTPPTNQHVILSGTGLYKHGQRTLWIHPAAFQVTGGNGRYNNTGYMEVAANAVAHGWIPLETGKRIVSVTVYYTPNGAGTVTPGLINQNATTAGSPVALWTGTADTTGTTVESQTSGVLNHTLAANNAYAVQVGMTNAANRLFGAAVLYDQP